MYELCLEYGTFPISLRSDDLVNLQDEPDFLKDEPELLHDLREMNNFFHSLFIEIEGNLDFIGREEPEKIENLRQEYQRISELVKEKFPDVVIEHFYLA